MKVKLFLLPLSVLTLLALSTVSARSQTVITFDDLRLTGVGEYLPNGYQGLDWNNFYCLNGVLVTTNDGLHYGIVSGSNVAFNAGGDPAQIDSVGTNFNFLGAYFTGLWNSNLNVQVEGFNGTNLIYDQTLVASATNPTLVTFDYLNIDRLYFDSYGGETAFGFDYGPEFVMDNFTFEFIPEPSTFLLAALGGVSLVAFLRRRRV